MKYFFQKTYLSIAFLIPFFFSNAMEKTTQKSKSNFNANQIFLLQQTMAQMRHNTTPSPAAQQLINIQILSLQPLYRKQLLLDKSNSSYIKIFSQNSSDDELLETIVGCRTLIENKDVIKRLNKIDKKKLENFIRHPLNANRDSITNILMDVYKPKFESSKIKLEPGNKYLASDFEHVGLESLKKSAKNKLSQNTKDKHDLINLVHNTKDQYKKENYFNRNSVDILAGFAPISNENKIKRPFENSMRHGSDHKEFWNDFEKTREQNKEKRLRENLKNLDIFSDQTSASQIEFVNNFGKKVKFSINDPNLENILNSIDLDRIDDQDLFKLPEKALGLETVQKRTAKYITSIDNNIFASKYSDLKKLKNKQALHQKVNSFVKEAHSNLSAKFVNYLKNSNLDTDFIEYYHIFNDNLFINNKASWQNSEKHLLQIVNSRKFKSLHPSLKDKAETLIKEINREKRLAKNYISIISSINTNSCSDSEAKKIIQIRDLINNNPKIKSRLDDENGLYIIREAAQKVVEDNTRKLLNQHLYKQNHNFTDYAVLKSLKEITSQESAKSQSVGSPEFINHKKRLYEFLNNQINPIESKTGIKFVDLHNINLEFGLNNQILPNGLESATPFQATLINNLGSIANQPIKLDINAKNAIKNLTKCAIELNKKDPEAAKDFASSLNYENFKEFFKGATTETLNQSKDIATGYFTSKATGKILLKAAPKIARITPQIVKFGASKTLLPLQVGYSLYNLYQDADLLLNDIQLAKTAFYQGEYSKAGKYSVKTISDFSCAALGLKDLFKSCKTKKQLKNTFNSIKEGVEIAKVVKSPKSKRAQKNLQEAVFKCHNHQYYIQKKLTRKGKHDYESLETRPFKFFDKNNELFNHTNIFRTNDKKNTYPAYTFNNLKHLFELELKCERGKKLLLSGFHHDHLGKLRKSGLLNFTEIEKGPLGTWKARVWYKGEKKKCSFFPENWSKKEVLEEIITSWNNIIKIEPNKKNNNLEIKGKIIKNSQELIIETIVDPNGNIKTAYPKLNEGK